jgi:hypothetical protein
MTETTVNKEECIELKNIKYKTMLLSGNIISDNTINNSENLTHLDKFLEENKITNQNEPWSKLNKTIKTKKLLIYAEKYKNMNNLDNEERNSLIKFLKDCLDRKKLQRVKDVNYDKTNGEIKDVPALLYNKQNKHFTLKNIDKRVNTLKSLPPKKIKETI